MVKKKRLGGPDGETAEAGIAARATSRAFWQCMGRVGRKHSLGVYFSYFCPGPSSRHANNSIATKLIARRT